MAVYKSGGKKAAPVKAPPKVAVVKPVEDEDEDEEEDEEEEEESDWAVAGVERCKWSVCMCARLLTETDCHSLAAVRSPTNSRSDAAAATHLHNSRLADIRY